MTTGNTILQTNQINTTPFEFHSIKWIKQNRGQGFYQPNRVGNYVIMIITEGIGLFSIDTATFNIEKGSAYCLMPGQVHFISEEHAIDGVYISFSGDFVKVSEEGLSPFLQSGLSGFFLKNPEIHLTEDNFQEIADITLKLQKEFEHFFLLRAELLRSYLKILFIYLTRENQPSEDYIHKQRSSDITEKFFELLERNFREKKKVNEYANELALTSNYLNEKIKEKTGRPVSYHIKERIIQEARRLALYSSASLKEIAFELGFDDAAHFSRYFKNNAGKNFTEFRKTFANKTNQGIGNGKQ